MKIANWIADEYHNKGFRVRTISSNGVMVSLTNRKVNIIEVEMAIVNDFDINQMQFRPTNNGVLVSW